jgi:hypothetical protein
MPVDLVVNKGLKLLSRIASSIPAGVVERRSTPGTSRHFGTGHCRASTPIAKIRIQRTRVLKPGPTTILDTGGTALLPCRLSLSVGGLDQLTRVYGAAFAKTRPRQELRFSSVIGFFRKREVAPLAVETPVASSSDWALIRMIGRQ